MKSSFSAEFIAKLNLEITINERKRIGLIAIIFSIILCYVSANRFLIVDPSNIAFDNLKQFYPKIALILVSAILYETLLVYILSTFIKKAKQIPDLLRYLNATAEISIPSLALLLFIDNFDVLDAFHSPPTYVTFFFIFLSILRLNFRLCVFSGFMAFTQFMIIFFLYSSEISAHPKFEESILLSGIFVKAFLYLLSGIVAGFISKKILQSFQDSLISIQAQEKIQNIFDAHVSPQIARELVESENSANESKLSNVCVMFLDIRNFTSFSEKHSPQEVVDFLNTFFKQIIPEVTNNQGIVNKFLGDGFMAIFGAPHPTTSPCDDALQAALDIRKQCKQLVNDSVIPKTSLGIGLHYGEVVTGSIGSQERQEYTIIGDVVNMASRIESLNKKFNSSILVSDILISQLQKPLQEIKIKNHGLIQVKGKETKIEIVELL